MNIPPGEPVPPGFEDEVNQIAEIESAIKRYKGGPLIGVEYTVELFSQDEREPSYLCMLCDKRGDPRTIFAHWISFNHRFKYMEKHYMSVIRELAPYKYPDTRNLMPTVIQRIAEAIEDHHGRLMPIVCDSSVFQRNRAAVLQDVIGAKHCDERNGPSFVDLIDRNLLEGAVSNYSKKNRDPSPPHVKAPVRNSGKHPPNAPAVRRRNSLDSISSESDSGARHAISEKKKKRRSQSPAYKVISRVRRSPPFEEERDTDKGKSLPTPKELSLQASAIAQEKYKWEKYRCMFEISLKDLENTLKEYGKNPEKHPLYPEEWKKFWNRRYKELQQAKKDPNKYDYKPEWIVFWTRRMKELHDLDVEKKKVEIKTKLGLPLDAEEKTDQLKQQFKITISNPTDATSVAKSKDNENKEKPLPVIDISDDEETLTGSRGRDKKSPKESKRHRRSSRSRSSLSSVSEDYDRERDHTRRGRHRGKDLNYERSRSRERYRDRSRSRERERDRYPHHHAEYRSREYRSGYYPMPGMAPIPYPGYRVMDPHKYPKYEEEKPVKKPEPEEEPEQDDGPLTVVAVLRLLTALEDYLGSLGPKVVDMLGKALALEKVKANSSDDMLLNEDNCVFFETIKEKLKGQLIANVLEDSSKVRAVKKAVKNIAGIIHQVCSKGESTTPSDDKEKDKLEEKGKVVPKPATNTKDLPFDRQIVSSKLAAALVMQGREDISTEDMDKLIFVFLLMVKLNKGREEETPIQTKDILVELGVIPPKPVISAIAEVAATTKDLVEAQNPIALIEEDDEEEEVSTAQNCASALESLTDSDLQTLLQNFKHLSSEEQHHLIAHLKKLETVDPIRVEKLRKYVNVSNDENDKPPTQDGKKGSKTDSPSMHTRKYLSDDEDDDYNFEDVVKVVNSRDSVSRDGENSNASRTTAQSLHSKSDAGPSQVKINNTAEQIHSANVTTSTTFNSSNLTLTDTQNLIANLMGTLQKNNTGQTSNTTGLSSFVNQQNDNSLESSSSLPFYQQQQSLPQNNQQSFINYPMQQQSPFYNMNFNTPPNNNFNMFGGAQGMQGPYGGGMPHFGGGPSQAQLQKHNQHNFIYPKRN